MKNSVKNFYDELSNDYHLIFQDWDKSIERQAKILSKMLQSHNYLPPCRLLDCSCGIGTQALGLALRGYTVHATDISTKSVERAKKEAKERGIEIDFGIADFRTLNDMVRGDFDVIISCDNSLPHLLKKSDLMLAVKNIFKKLKHNGLFLGSIRDYDEMLVSKPTTTPLHVFKDKKGRKRIVFQVWDWSHDNKSYNLNHFIVQENKDIWETSCYSTKYRVLKRDELTTALSQVGFSDIAWHMPDKSNYYQPIVIARKR